MAQKSTAIVRAKVTGVQPVLQGGDVYTVYRLETLENLKASAAQPVSQVAVAGGVAGGIRQFVDGAPALQVGRDYVLFLWAGRSGLNQIMGLSQGLFSIEGGNVTRAPAGERMLDASGRQVQDAPLNLKLSELKARVKQALTASEGAGR